MGVLAGAIAVVAVLPGCGGGGGGAGSGAPTPEVKLEPIKDASGKEQSISEEGKLPGGR
jgi:hypothetical protein